MGALALIISSLLLALPEPVAPVATMSQIPQQTGNPCLAPGGQALLCPDLVMRRPYDLRLDRRGPHVVLRAANSLDNAGRGPAELVGRRSGRVTMTAKQRIHRLRAHPRVFDTRARLVFKAIPGQYRYWKFANAARFDLWQLNRRGTRRRLVRTGPKLSYCLRDLEATRLSLPGAPRKRVYPACSQDPRARRLRLGTSVGWSDIYPASYYEQWIDVTGLRGCFAYSQVADPEDGIHELDERNNESAVTVRLPFRRSARPCPRDRGPRNG